MERKMNTNKLTDILNVIAEQTCDNTVKFEALSNTINFKIFTHIVSLEYDVYEDSVVLYMFLDDGGIVDYVADPASFSEIEDFEEDRRICFESADKAMKASLLFS